MQLSHKNKLKSEIFNDKKKIISKIFFSVVTKNSNWEILPNNLLRQHRQKTFVTLSGFWPLKGFGGLSESVKKEHP